VPPLIGFFAKLFLLESVLLAGYAWLVLLALVTSVIGAVAAARLLRLMFVDLPDEGEAPVPSAGGAVRIAIGFCALVTVLLLALVPLAQVVRPQLVPALRSASSQRTEDRNPAARRVAVWLQIGISFALLVSTGALVQSFLNTRTQSIGLTRNQVLVAFTQDPDAAIRRVHDLGFPTCQVSVGATDDATLAKLRAALQRYSVEATSAVAGGPGPEISVAADAVHDGCRAVDAVE